MTREKALMRALKIIDICKTYGNEDRCKLSALGICDENYLLEAEKAVYKRIKAEKN